MNSEDGGHEMVLSTKGGELYKAVVSQPSYKFAGRGEFLTVMGSEYIHTGVELRGQLGVELNADRGQLGVELNADRGQLGVARDNDTDDIGLGEIYLFLTPNWSTNIRAEESTEDNLVVVPTNSTEDNLVVVPTNSTEDNLVAVPTNSTKHTWVGVLIDSTTEAVMGTNEDSPNTRESPPGPSG